MRGISAGRVQIQLALGFALALLGPPSFASKPFDIGPLPAAPEAPGLPAELALTPEIQGQIDRLVGPHFNEGDLDHVMSGDLGSLNNLYHDSAPDTTLKTAVAVILRAVTQAPESWPGRFYADLPPATRTLLAQKSARLRAVAARQPELAKQVEDISLELWGTRTVIEPRPVIEQQAAAEALEAVRRFAEKIDAAFNTKSVLVLGGPDYRTEGERVVNFANEAKVLFGMKSWGTRPEEHEAFQKFVLTADSKSRFHADFQDWISNSKDSSYHQEATWIYRHFFEPFNAVTEGLRNSPSLAAGPTLERYLLKGLANMQQAMQNRPCRESDHAHDAWERIQARTSTANGSLDRFLNAVDAMLAAKAPLLTPSFVGAVKNGLRAMLEQAGWTEDSKHKVKLVLAELERPPASDSAAIVPATSSGPLSTTAILTHPATIICLILACVLALALWAWTPVLIYAASMAAILVRSAKRLRAERRASARALQESDPDHVKALADLEKELDIRARIEALPGPDPIEEQARAEVEADEEALEEEALKRR